MIYCNEKCADQWSSYSQSLTLSSNRKINMQQQQQQHAICYIELINCMCSKFSPPKTNKKVIYMSVAKIYIFYFYWLMIIHCSVSNLWFWQVFNNDRYNSTFSGAFDGKIIVSRSNQLRVTFRSDSTINGKGFLASYKAGIFVAYIQKNILTYIHLQWKVVVS